MAAALRPAALPVPLAVGLDVVPVPVGLPVVTVPLEEITIAVVVEEELEGT